MIDYDRFCRRCKSYSFDLTQGIVCGLTGEKPVHEIECPDFILDEKKQMRITYEKERSARAEKRAEEMDASESLAAHVMKWIVELVDRIEDALKKGQ